MSKVFTLALAGFALLGAVLHITAFDFKPPAPELAPEEVIAMKAAAEEMPRPRVITLSSADGLFTLAARPSSGQNPNPAKLLVAKRFDRSTMLHYAGLVVDQGDVVVVPVDSDLWSEDSLQPALGDFKIFDAHARSMNARLVLAYASGTGTGFETAMEREIQLRVREAGLVFIPQSYERLFNLASEDAPEDIAIREVAWDN